MEKIRILELPKCKMVTSGAQKDFDFSDQGALGKFGRWWSWANQKRKDLFYNRDYIWYDKVQEGLVWGYALYEGLDPEEYEVIDFPGGLYAVATYRDEDEADNLATYNAVLDWVNSCQGFDLDPSRYALGQIGSPYSGIAKSVLGYEQMDCYVPIKPTAST